MEQHPRDRAKCCSQFIRKLAATSFDPLDANCKRVVSSDPKSKPRRIVRFPRFESSCVRPKFVTLRSNPRGSEQVNHGRFNVLQEIVAHVEEPCSARTTQEYPTCRREYVATKCADVDGDLANSLAGIQQVGNHWKHLFEDSPLSDITPHVLRHSFASIANDLGFTEVTIAALVGHAKGSVTSKYIHTLDTALIILGVAARRIFSHGPNHVRELPLPRNGSTAPCQ